MKLLLAAIALVFARLKKPLGHFDTRNDEGVPQDFPQDETRIIPVSNTKDTPKVSTMVFHRLSLEAYNQLEHECAAPIPSNHTSDIQAGYLLGVQHVLSKLRKGFVVGT